MRINTIPDDVIPPFKVEEQDYWRHRAPLTIKARKYVSPMLERMGFAATPPKPQKSNISVRVVWIYPELRDDPPYEFYESAVTVSIPHDPCSSPKAARSVLGS